MRKTPFLFTAAALAFTAAAAFAQDVDFRFHAFPNPFVAGYNGTRLSYYLPRAATVTATVYDAGGKRVQTLTEDAARAAGVHNAEEVWFGRDEDGDLVAPGAYFIVLEIRMGGKVYREHCTVVVNR